MFDRKSYKKEGWAESRGLTKKMLAPLLVSALIMLGLYAAVILPQSKTYSEVFESGGKAVLPLAYMLKSYALSFVVGSIMCIMGYAWAIFMFNHRRSGEFSFSAFTGCFSEKMIRAALWNYLWILIWMLPFNGGAVLIQQIFANAADVQNVAPVDATSVDTAKIMGQAFLSVFILYSLLFYMIFAYRKMLGYSVMEYILAENPQISVLKAMKLSKKMCRGCRENLFVMELSFLPWYLLGIVTLGFGMIFVIPYRTLTYLNAYEAIKKNALETKAVSEEDFYVLR